MRKVKLTNYNYKLNSFCSKINGIETRLSGPTWVYSIRRAYSYSISNMG